MSRITMKDVLATRAVLAERFPLAFFPKGEPKRPLVIGIRHAVIDACPDIPPRMIKAAIANYTGGRQYLEAMQQGVARINLDGESCDLIASSDVGYAVDRLRRYTGSPLRSALETIAAFKIEDPANLDALALKGIAVTALATRQPEVSHG